MNALNDLSDLMVHEFGVGEEFGDKLRFAPRRRRFSRPPPV